MYSNYGDNFYDIKVVDSQSLDGHSGDGEIISGCLVVVYDAGTKTESTIYGSAARASLANPITRSQFASDDRIKFWSSASSHDIMVAHSDGSVGYFTVTPQTHSVSLDRAAVDKCLVVPLVFNDNTETDTGIDLPLDSLVYDARVYVKTADSSETIDVGLLSSETAGDANGFIAAADIGTAGWPALVTATAGSNETYLSAVKYGALLGSFVAGADAAGDVGTFLPKGHLVTGSNAKSITYTCSAGSDAFEGYLYVMFKKLR